MAMSSLHYLATWARCAWRRNPATGLRSGDAGLVEAFLDAPLEWSAKHGGVSELRA